MSTNKHTPGPWVSSYYASDEFAPLNIDGCFVVGVGRFEQPVAMIWHGDENGAVVSEDEAEATANLIAAAPELLEALRAFSPDVALASLLWEGMDDDASGTVTVKLRDLRRAMSAVAKAEGQS